MSLAGFVYVLTNEGLPGHVKVRRSCRATQIRVHELHKQYGTIYPFQVHSKQMVADCTAVETLAHRSLKWARVPRSELFSCTPAVAQKAVRRAAIMILERPWHVRVWHWIVLPRPQRARNACVGRGSRQQAADRLLEVMGYSGSRCRDLGSTSFSARSAGMVAVVDPAHRLSA